MESHAPAPPPCLALSTKKKLISTFFLSYLKIKSLITEKVVCYLYIYIYIYLFSIHILCSLSWDRFIVVLLSLLYKKHIYVYVRCFLAWSREVSFLSFSILPWLYVLINAATTTYYYYLCCCCCYFSSSTLCLAASMV